MIDFGKWIAEQADALRQSEVWRNAVTVTNPVQPGTGFVINIDGKQVVAQFIVWTTGTMEATAGAVGDCGVFYVDAAPIVDQAMLDERWRHFCAEILRVEECD